MASGQHADELKLTPEELKRPGESELPGAPIVHVEAVEGVKPESTGPSTTEQGDEVKRHQTPPVTHETPAVKTTVNEEEDVLQKASIMDKVKGKVQEMEDKLRPHSSVQAKENDPHPSLT
ncbi:hypothetical protein R1flu_024435 [Riccia fluitans]|uniref:Uncharacterized protein n=1 Tax=Riccia fluitans TaxID=41844 RepID=A0ABD1XUV5_9MARC